MALDYAIGDCFHKTLGLGHSEHAFPAMTPPVVSIVLMQSGTSMSWMTSCQMPSPNPGPQGR